MKASRYNFFIEEDSEEVLAYNALTGAFACIGRELYKLFLDVCSNPYVEKTDRCSVETNSKLSDVIAGFRKNGFLIRDDLDEIELLKNMQYQKRFLHNNILDITIVPTLSCNFDCIYCFEKDKDGKQYMTRETANCIIRYIDEYFSSGGELNVGWFGGEPTLSPDIICYIMDSVMDIAARKQVNYFSRITTNGYFLDEKMALELKKRGVKEAGITIDGGPQAHNGRRSLKSGKGTFDTIVENIKSITDIINVSVKFTADRDNVKDFPGLLDILEKSGLRKKIRVEVSSLEAYPYSCELVKERALCTEEFSKVYLELMGKVVERGFQAILLPLKHRIACTAVSRNSLVVGPEGELYKCIATVGMDNQVFGNIREPVEPNINFDKWLSHLPLEYEDCINCNILPICMGGCSRNTLLKESAPLNVEGCCMQFRYNLQQLVKLMYRKYAIKMEGYVGTDIARRSGIMAGLGFNDETQYIGR